MFFFYLFSNGNINSLFKNIFIKTKIRHLLLAVYVALLLSYVVIIGKNNSKRLDTAMKRIFIIFTTTVED
jgi:hypothetical protein